MNEQYSSWLYAKPCNRKEKQIKNKLNKSIKHNSSSIRPVFMSYFLLLLNISEWTLSTRRGVKVGVLIPISIWSWNNIEVHMVLYSKLGSYIYFWFKTGVSKTSYLIVHSSVSLVLYSLRCYWLLKDHDSFKGIDFRFSSFRIVYCNDTRKTSIVVIHECLFYVKINHPKTQG